MPRTATTMSDAVGPRPPMPPDPTGSTSRSASGAPDLRTRFFGAQGMIDRYELLEVLGTGSEGVVYLARDPVIDRVVALKMSPLQQTDAELRSRRLREVRSAGKLAHPNIVTVYDAGVVSDTCYIVFERVAGPDLEQLLREEGAIAWPRASALVADLADALDHAHERGVIHRDIKPANILVPDGKRALLTDFGIARTLDVSISETGDLRGTPAYMAPEYLTERSDPTPSTDLFALGVVFFQLLTGDLPFRGKNLPETFTAIVSGPEPDPRSHDATIPDAVAAICRRCIARDPSERYASAADLRDDLRRLLFTESTESSSGLHHLSSGTVRLEDPTEPTTPLPAVPASSPKEQAQKRIRWPWLALALMVVGVVGAALFLDPPSEPSAAAAVSSTTDRPETVEPPADETGALTSTESTAVTTQRVSLPVGLFSDAPRGTLRLRQGPRVVFETTFDFERQGLLRRRADGRADYEIELPAGPQRLHAEVARPGRDKQAAAGIEVDVTESGKLWVNYERASGVSLWYEPGEPSR